MTRSLVVEADGGSRGNPGPAAYGAVVKDGDTGEVLVERAEFIGTASNNVAEYRGVIAGLEEAHRIDPDARIDVRLDSKLVVEQMSGRWKIKHPDMRELALRARDIHDMAAITWTWVPRSQNAHADRLLNEVLDGEVPGPSPGRNSVVRRPLTQPLALGEPTTMYLLRHGETPMTIERRFSGRGGEDAGLADTGHRQAERAASLMEDRLGGTRLSAIVCSPLLRAVQTAQPVADRLGLTIEIDEDLAEMSFGEWDGLTFAGARERDPEFFDSWFGNPSVAPPGGESLTAFAARVEDARLRVVERYDRETVLVVSHAMIVKVLVQSAMAAPIEAVHRVDVLPASLSEIAYWDDGIARVQSLGLR